MSAPLIKHAKNGKLTFREGTAKENENELMYTVEHHYFNHAIDIVLPSCRSLPLDVLEQFKQWRAYVVHELPAAAIIDPDLIGAFINAGKFYALSHGTRINSDNCVAVLPTGHMILHLTSDTYIQLGLEGRPSWYNRLGQNKYVVDIDLKATCFAPGRKNYERVLESLARSKLKFNLLTAWEPSDENLCPSSVQKYFQIKGYQCHSLHMQGNQHNYSKLNVLQLSSQDVQKVEVFDWLGMVANQVDLSHSPDEFISTYSYTGPMEEMTCLHYQISGFFTTDFVSTLLSKLWSSLNGLGSAWCSVTVHGYQDTPISWSNHPHGFTNCGDNLYSTVLFPSQKYWVYRALGCHSKAS